MDMFMHAVGQPHPLAHGLSVDKTVEIDPFPAVFCPCLAAKSDRDFPGNHRLFQRSQMFARHLGLRQTDATAVDAPPARIVCSRSGPTETISTGRPTISLSRFR